MTSAAGVMISFRKIAVTIFSMSGEIHLREDTKPVLPTGLEALGPLADYIAAEVAERLGADFGISKPEAKSFYTDLELPALLGVSRQLVHDLCISGDIKATKKGRRWYVLAADLDAYVAAGRKTE